MIIESNYVSCYTGPQVENRFRAVNMGRCGRKISLMKTIKENNLMFLALLVLFVLASFSPVLKNQFINFDDNKFIYDNKLIQSERIEYSSILKEQIFSPNYKPLVYVVWAIEYRLFRNNPGGYHLVNLLLHVLNTILVFLIIHVLTRKFFLLKNTAFAAFLATLIFALHPLKVESVAWAVELKDMLFAFWYFFSLISYLYYLKDRRPFFLMISIIAFLFGIFSKSMIISLPVVLFVVDYLYGRSLKDGFITEKVPYFILLCFGLYLYGISLKFLIPLLSLLLIAAYLSTKDYKIRVKYNKTALISVAGFAIVFIIALWAANYAGFNTVLIRNQADFALSDQPVINFLIIASGRIYFWLLKIIYPASLALVYVVPDFLIGRQLPGYTLLFPLSLVITLTFIFHYFRDNRFLIFVIAFFLITIFPALISAPAGTNFLPDRYTYISSLSFSLIFVLLINRLKKYSPYLYVAMGVYIVHLGLKTHSYCREWKDSISIWTASLKSDESWQAYFNRSQAYFLMKEYEKSYSDINRAIQLEKTSSDAYFNRGLTLIPLKSYSMAINDFDMAIKLNPGNTKAISYKAMCYFYLGEYGQAIDLCSFVLEKEPQNIKTYLTRAISKEKLKDYNGAIQDFSAIINLEPLNGENYYRRGITKLLNRDTTGSCEDWKLSKDLKFEKASEMIVRYCK